MQSETQLVFEELFKDPENTACFECGIQSHDWASVNNGVFLCLNCSGLHRGFGVYVSFVRSVSMDNWSETQLSMMKNGGNAKLRQFFESYKIPKDGPIDFKYNTKAGAYYREQLKAIAEGKPEPEAPPVEEGLELINNKNPNFSSGSIVGFGSSENSGEEEEKEKLSIASVKQGVYSLGSSVYVGAKNLATKVNEKMHDPNLKDEVKGLGSKLATGTIETAGKLASGTKDVAGKVATGTIETAGKLASGTKEVAGKIATGTYETAGKLASGTKDVAGKLATGTKETAGKVAEKSKEIWTHRDEYLQKGSEAAKQGWNVAFGFVKKLTGKKENAPNNNNNNVNTEALDTNSSSP